MCSLMLLTICFSCREQSGYIVTESKQFSNQVKFGNIAIYKSFESQIKAFEGEKIDSNIILNEVYRTHKVLWDSCYGMIFGP